MTSPNDIAGTLRLWLTEIPKATDAADTILRKAETKGCVPKQITCPHEQHAALVAFFSDRYVRAGTDSRGCKLLFSRWEAEVLRGDGAFLADLATARGRKLRNRKQEKLDRAAQIRSALTPFVGTGGLPGFVAERELANLEQQKGRYWYRSEKTLLDEIGNEIRRYVALLQFVEQLRNEPTRIERVVHASRQVVGDTHWLRPGNPVWRDLAEDELQFTPLPPELEDSLTPKEKSARALSLVGLVENLTSVTVLAFGHFAIVRHGSQWNWASDAAQQGLPIWLSAQHLVESGILHNDTIRQVISIENETSFLDLTELYGGDPETVLVYTEGHANRAVVALLRLLAQACPNVSFHHQGDLDLAGVRILSSLIERTRLQIEPMYMDVDTHRRFEATGLRLSKHELGELDQAIAYQQLPCLDLLRCISESCIRVEQESITATAVRAP